MSMKPSIRRNGVALLLAAIVIVASSSVARAGRTIQPAGIAQSGMKAFLVDQSLCRVEPRPVEDFLAVAGTPGAVSSMLLGTPVATPPPPGVGSGVPASQDVVEEVSGTASELVACLNAGDIRRVTALYTEDNFRRLFGGIGQEEVRSLIESADPLPPDQRITLTSVADVRVLDDGRVSALTTVGDAKSLSIFLEIDGRYRLDYSYSLPASATPSS